MNDLPTITIDPDEIERLRQLIPKEEGVFCKGDLIVAFNITPNEAQNLLRRWRNRRVIAPAGKVTRINPWGDKTTRVAYRLVEKEEDAIRPEGK